MKRRHTLSGRLFAGALGEDTTLTSTPPDLASLMSSIDKLAAQQSAMSKQLEEDARNRRIALYIGAASALFAAVKLGIIAFPHLKARVTPRT